MLFNKMDPDAAEKAAMAKKNVQMILDMIDRTYVPVSVDSLMLSDDEALPLLESEPAGVLP